MKRLEMKNYITILTERKQKTYKYEYLTDEGILPSDQRRMVEQAKFMHPLLLKALKRKTMEDQGKKQIIAIEDHGKQLVESNVLMKMDFNINRYSILHEEQKKFE